MQEWRKSDNQQRRQKKEQTKTKATKKLLASSPYNKTSDVFSPEYKANTSRRIDFSADVITNTSSNIRLELELELIQTQMAQKPMLRAEVGMRVRCANKASAE